MNIITNHVKGVQAGFQYPINQEVTKNADGSGGTIYKQTKEKGFWNQLGHGALDVLGMIPAVGNVADGINAARLLMPKCYFDRDKCHTGLEMMKQYRQEWDEKKKRFRDQPRHDYTSHAADAFRYLAIGINNRTTYTKPPQSIADNDYNIFA